MYASKIINIVKQKMTLSIPVEADSRIHEDLGISEIVLLEIIVDLEEKFRMAIPDESIKNIFNVQDLITLVGEHLKLLDAA